MTHAVVQYRKSGKTMWSQQLKIFFTGDGSARELSYNSADLGDLTVVLEHLLKPHVVKVKQAAQSEVKLRTDSEPLAVLKPDGGKQTIFEHKDKDGTEWHLYHASEGTFSKARRK